MTSTTSFLLLDEGSSPSLRAVLGRLLASSGSADLAVGRIRLAALDLSEVEMAPRRCRVLLGHLDASTLMDTGVGRRPVLERLHRWATGGRLQIRSAGIGRWSPDFSIFHDSDGATSLLGSHYFGAPQHTMGPAFTAITTDPATAARLATRFQELWDGAHDVLPAIVSVLERFGAAVDTPEGDVDSAFPWEPDPPGTGLAEMVDGGRGRD